jgi:hypothetical protein
VSEARDNEAMPEWLILAMVLALYFILTQWVLPRFGIST